MEIQALIPITPKLDFRIFLNTILLIYYKQRTDIYIHEHLYKYKIPFEYEDLIAANKMLIKDGYIEEPLQWRSPTPQARITGQGRIFYEAGGYKDNTTYLDKITEKAKNNKPIAWTSFIFIGVSAIFGIITWILQIIDFFSKP